MGRYLFLPLFISFFNYAFGQSRSECDLSLTGQVIDQHDQSELSFATVYLLEISRGVVADSNGKFELTELCRGQHTLVVSHVSCQPDTVVVSISKNTHRDLYLEHHTEYLQQVTITGQNLQQAQFSDQQQSLNIDSLNRFSFQNLGNLLNELPGVSSLKTGSQIVKPVIQGLYGSRVVTVNHGVRMQDMEWGDEHTSMVDIGTAEQVKLLSGGAALRYGGEAVAGLILLEPSKIPEDTLIGSTTVHGASNGWGGSIDSDLAKSWKSGWYSKFQASLKRFGDFHAPDYQLTNTGFFDKGISLTAGKHLKKSNFEIYYSYFDSEIAILSASHIGSISDLVNSINSREPLIIEDFSYEINPPKQRIEHHIVRMELNHKTGIGNWHWQYDYQRNHRFEFDKRLGENRNRPSIDLQLSTHTFSGNLSINEKSELPIEIGVLYRYQNHFANPETGVRRLIPDYDKYEAGGYINGRYRLNEIFQIDAGVRYDFSHIDAMKFYQKSRWEERGYDQDFSRFVVKEFPTQLLTNPVFSYHNLSYTAGAHISLNDYSEFRVNYFFSKRAPNPSELFSEGLHHGAARIELGDLRIQPENSYKFGVGYNGRRRKLNWDLSGYANNISDFIVAVPTGVELTLRGAFPVWEYQQTNAILWGLDGKLTANWSRHWQTQHMARYIYGQDKKNDQPLINIPAPQINNSVIFNSESWKSLSITLESQYTFRQNRYPDIDLSVFVPEDDGFEELDLGSTPDGYHLINLHSMVKVLDSKSLNLHLGIGINNLFDTKYRDYLNRLRFFADEVGRSFEISMKLEY